MKLIRVERGMNLAEGSAYWCWWCFSLLQCHPDKLEDGMSEVERAAAVHAFHKITKAYKLLSNPELRRTFDVKCSGEYINQSCYLVKAKKSY